MTARATIVGAGGLGGPIAFALASAGVELTIFDPDIVELSNLPRQLQFTRDDLGAPKASKLADAIVARGGRAHARVEAWRGDADDGLLVDASDDPVTKFAVGDAAIAAGRRTVIAAALRYGGNVFAGAPGAACYRCLFEEPVAVASCAGAGVLGPVVGAIGGVAAAVALQLLAGNDAAAGSLLVFDDLRAIDPAIGPRVVRFAPRADCPSCGGA